MSTTSKSSEPTENRAGHYAKFDEYVDFQIAKTGSNIKANDLLTTGVGISTIFLGYLLIFVIFDHWIIKGGFGHTSRLLMLATVVLASLGWAVWKLIIPYFKKVTRLYAAHSLEKTSNEMEGSLLNLIDLKKSNRPINPDIINTLEKKAALTLSKTDTDQAIDRRPLMNLSYSLLVVVALLCFYALFSPKEIWPSVSAAMTFSAQREFATQTQINSVTPGNTEVLSGSQLEVIVDLRGEVPEKVMLFYSSSDQGRVDEPIALRSMDDTLKRYQGVIVGVNGRGIRQELTYHIQAGDAVSDNFQVKVIQPPSATVHSVRYEYPQYMGLSGVEQPGGAIDAWEGTKITVDATTNMPISSFEVLFADKEDSASLLEEFKIEKTINKNTITASWKLKIRADGSSPNFYQIKCRNEAGQTTLSPTVYPLMIRPDLSPEITLLSPKQDLKLPANGTVPISVIAEDPDFKIRYLNLRVERDQIRLLDKTLFEGAEKQVSLNQDFSLEPLRLTPGDTIFFWVEARDNKLPSGNRKNTPKIKIEILEPVSKEEAKKQLQEQKKQLQQENQKQNAAPKNESGNKQDKNSQTGSESSKSKPDPSEKSKSGEGTKKGDQAEEGTDQQKQDPKGKQQPESDKPQQSEKPTTGQKQKKPGDKGLDSTGRDDQEAIKKILEQLKKEGEEPESDPKQKEPGSEKPDSQNQSTDPKMQGQNSKSSEDSSPSKSKSSKNSDGSPQGSENKDSQAQESSKANQSDNNSSNQKPQNKPGPVPDGKKESASPSDDATKTKSKGTPEGKATPDHDPDAKPEKSSKNVQRDPKDKPATRPGKNEPSDSKPKQGNQPDKQNQSPDKSNSATENKPEKGMRKSENSNQNPSPTQKQTPSKGESKKQKDNQVDGSNNRPQGKKESSDQKSKRPQDGENGQSSKNDQGQSGSKQPGKGDSSGKKGNQEQGGQKKSSDSAQSMKQNDAQKKQGDSASKPGKSGAGKQGAGSKSKGGSSEGKGQSKPGGKPGSGSSTGSKSDNPQGSSATNGGASATEGNKPSSSEGSPGLPEAEDANLEYGKEAANLVLKRINDELKRKEVDQELLNELGWSKEEMKQFSERLQKQLQNPDLNQQSPESLAKKRQFEEMLKSLKPASRAKNRNRTSTRKQTNDSLGPRRLPIPEEYREAYEAFTRGLAEQKPVDK